MMFAVAAIPLIGVAGLAIDYYRATSAAAELQTLADSAALAAAAASNLSGSTAQQRAAREVHAKSYLNAAFTRLDGVEITGGNTGVYVIVEAPIVLGVVATVVGNESPLRARLEDLSSTCGGSIVICCSTRYSAGL